MKKPERTFVVRGFNNLKESFVAPTGVIEDKPTFKEVVVNTQAEAITVLLADSDIGTMSVPHVLDDHINVVYGNPSLPNPENPENMIHVLDLIISLDITDKLHVRDVKSILREIIKRWAEKSRVKRARGYRANAIKTPLFEYRFDETRVKVQVILSNAIIYSDRQVNISQRDYDYVHSDVGLLAKELSKQLGWKFNELSVKSSMLANQD